MANGDEQSILLLLSACVIGNVAWNAAMRRVAAAASDKIRQRIADFSHSGTAGRAWAASCEGVY
jgi:hypothetical protein